MIFDVVKRLPLYENLIPQAVAVAQMLARAGFDADDAGTHGVFEVRHKQYETRPDEKRLFEVHDHTIDLMVCTSGREMIHICDAAALAEGDPLPEGQDGRKLLGAPQGTSCLLAPGTFIAIFPGEAHMVAGQIAGTPEMVDKLVIKLPVVKAGQDLCPCESDCPRHGKCDVCVVWHRSPDNSLPTCLREKGRVMVERAR